MLPTITLTAEQFVGLPSDTRVQLLRALGICDHARSESTATADWVDADGTIQTVVAHGRRMNEIYVIVWLVSDLDATQPDAIEIVAGGELATRVREYADIWAEASGEAAADPAYAIAMESDDTDPAAMEAAEVWSHYDGRELAKDDVA